jgi:hypothetical protein
MKLNENSIENLSLFKAIKVELYLNGIDLKIYHPASGGTVGVKSIFLARTPKVLMARETMCKLVDGLKEDETKMRKPK